MAIGREELPCRSFPDRPGAFEFELSSPVPDEQLVVEAPLHAELKGLPPILVQVGTAETLLDDATRIAEKLHAAGVDVRLAIWPNMLHVFPLFAPILSEGRDGCLEIGSFIRSKTA